MIRIGVIGGGLGTRCIIPKFREIENCQVEALMSGHYSNAQHLAKIYGIKYPCKNLDEMCSIPLDLICIASPPQFHYEQAIKIASHNINILCEKPFALTIPETNRLIDHFYNSKSKCFIDLELRFNPYFQYIKHHISEIGEIYNIKMHFESDLFLNKSIKNSWQFNEEEGGGIRLSIMPHFLDLLLYWIEANCISIRAHTISPVSKTITSEFCQVQMLFENNLLVELSASAIVPGPKTLIVELLGENGKFYFNTTNGLLFNNKIVDITLPQFYKNSESIFRSSFGCYARQLVSILETKEVIPESFTFLDDIKKIHQFLADIEKSAFYKTDIKYL